MESYARICWRCGLCIFAFLLFEITAKGVQLDIENFYRPVRWTNSTPYWQSPGGQNLVVYGSRPSSIPPGKHSVDIGNGMFYVRSDDGIQHFIHTPETQTGDILQKQRYKLRVGVALNNDVASHTTFSMEYTPLQFFYIGFFVTGIFFATGLSIRILRSITGNRPSGDI